MNPFLLNIIDVFYILVVESALCFQNNIVYKYMTHSNRIVRKVQIFEWKLVSDPQKCIYFTNFRQVI
jgi:hypothetical protein